MLHKYPTTVHLAHFWVARQWYDEVAHPQVEGVETDELAFQPAARFGPIMDEVHDRLVERCAIRVRWPPCNHDARVQAFFALYFVRCILPVSRHALTLLAPAEPVYVPPVYLHWQSIGA